MLSDIKNGLNTYLEAFGFMRRHGLWYYFLFPVIISLVVMGVFLVLKTELILFTNDLLTEWTGLDHSGNDIEGWTAAIIRGLVAVSIWVATAYIFWTFNKYIALIVLSPLLALLSEKTESILTGREFPFSLKTFLSDILRGVTIAVRNALIETVIIVLCTLIGFVFPLVSPVLFFLTFIVSAYFYGFSMMDYVSERHRLTMSEGVRLIRKNRVLAIANGGLFDVLMKIPVFGITFAPILGCVGATIALHRKYDLNHDLKNQLVK
jgi:CysZ protein